MTPNLVLQTLGTIWNQLEQQGLQVTLVGGLTLPIWNYPRSTQDIDLLLLVEDDQQLLLICEGLHCQPRRSPAIVELGSVRVLQTQYCPLDTYVDIDVDFLLGRSTFHEQVTSRAITIDYAGLGSKLRVATCEDLILLKLQSSRLIDLADCQRLIELNPGLDWEYLEHWSGELGLSDALIRIKG